MSDNIYETTIFGRAAEVTGPVLEFGLPIPDEGRSTPAAWGARFITNGSELDLVWNRQSTVWRDEDALNELVELLNGGVLDIIRGAYKSKYQRGDGRGDEDNEGIVADGRRVKAVGNTNASHGYFYVAAWLKGE